VHACGWCIWQEARWCMHVLAVSALHGDVKCMGTAISLLLVAPPSHAVHSAPGQRCQRPSLTTAHTCLSCCRCCLRVLHAASRQHSGLTEAEAPDALHDEVSESALKAPSVPASVPASRPGSASLLHPGHSQASRAGSGALQAEHSKASHAGPCCWAC
jgi:hypothetical protein